MKQVAQAVNGGLPRIVEVPTPLLRPGGVLVRTAWSLISAGTAMSIQAARSVRTLEVLFLGVSAL